MKLFVTAALFALSCLFLSSASVVVNAPSADSPKIVIDYADDEDDSVISSDSFQTKNSLLKATDPDEKETILKLSNFALNTLDKLDPDQAQRSLIDIIDSKKEFVNGIMYHLTLLVALTKDEPADQNKGLDDVGYVEKNICKIKILRTWATSQSLDNAQVVGSQCTPESRHGIMFKRSAKPRLVGGKTSADVNRADIKKAASLGLEKLAELSGANSQKKRVSRIVKASTQVVAGTLYDVTVEICDDDDKHSSKNTADGGTSPCEICTITSVEQVWMNSFEVIRSDCQSFGDLSTAFNSKNKRKSDEADKIARTKRSYRYEETGKSLYSEQFLSFMRTYDKTYAGEEEMSRRYRIFRANLKKIRHLQETEQATAVYGVNEFADLSRSEFQKRYSGFKADLRISTIDNNNNVADIPNVDLPDQFDWREHNVVTEVKNQGLCGSCWAFSVTGNVEGQYALKHKQLLSFSEQELVDCDQLDNGCGGGYMTNAYQAIEKLGGLETEQDYPYSGYGRKCHLIKNETVAQITSFVNISSDETKMAQWLLKNGPISIAINANAMQFYFGGISHPLKIFCSPKNVDHGVLIVGYGIGQGRFSKKPIPYWIVKNSWGSGWGNKGYYLVYRGAGVCGLNTYASSAFVA